MKKIVTVIITAAAVLLGCFAQTASAATLADGTYEVPVTLVHATKEKESLGNQYIAQKAYLTVQGGSWQIYILPSTKHASDFNKVQFYYYVSGTLNGSVKEASAVKNVTLGGMKVATAATFLLPIHDGDVPMQFKASMMPVTPSARLRINYASAKQLETKAVHTTVKAAAAAKTTAAPTKPLASPAAGTTAPATTVPPDTTSVTAPAAQETASSAEPSQESTATREKEPKSVAKSSVLKWWLIGVGAIVALLGLITICVKKK